MGGISIYEKGELKITSKRKITGPRAKRIGIFFVVTAVFGLFAFNEFLEIVSFLLYALSILIAAYYVLFEKTQ